jgi:hypothetical protein
MAFVTNVDFSSALSKPGAYSAVLVASLRRLLDEEGCSGFAEEIISLSEKNGKVAIRVTGPLVASALSLRQGKIEAAFEETLSKFGRKGKISVRIR